MTDEKNPESPLQIHITNRSELEQAGRMHIALYGRLDFLAQMDLARQRRKDFEAGALWLLAQLESHNPEGSGDYDGMQLELKQLARKLCGRSE